MTQMNTTGVVPVVVINDATAAKPLAQALNKGGLLCAEVTFRTKAAEESLRIMKEACPEMLIGAGTILTTEQADRAIAAGASFLVSPGLNPKVVKHCQDKGVLMVPGVMTPGEIEQAMELSLEAVKFFPAEPLGGINTIKMIAAPYSQMRFMPTGGITLPRLEEYLAFNRILACGGSWMVKAEWINSQNFAAIEEASRETMAIVKKMRG